MLPMLMAGSIGDTGEEMVDRQYEKTHCAAQVPLEYSCSADAWRRWQDAEATGARRATTILKGWTVRAHAAPSTRADATLG
eukprot:372593-Pleurochrysis_carterae.AAC.1